VAKFIRECALHYAEQNGIEDVDEEMKDKALQRIIGEHLGEQEYTCDCDAYIQDDDEYCWFCGNDVTEKETGGWEAEKAKSKKKGKSKVKGKGKKKASDKKEKEEEEEEEKLEDGALDAASESIRELDKEGGGNAWKIGKHLFEINQKQMFKQNKHKSFDVYCEKELGFQRQTAYGYIRIAEKFDEKDAKQLGVFKLLALASAPDKARPKLLKAAMSKVDGGKGLNRKQLKEAINEAWDKEPKEGKKAKSPGAPTKSPFKRFIGTKAKGNYDQDEESYILMLDDDVGIEIKLSGKDETKATGTFIELE